jgi:hypothetical protein
MNNSRCTRAYSLAQAAAIDVSLLFRLESSRMQSIAAACAKSCARVHLLLSLLILLCQGQLLGSSD